ncbi:hypothetical protein [Carboxydothermus hydrogenoformans]|uniref:Uncharacterized protein n=1 Tax=Carboxydothermus hydrogenoformans (strain ATCC BAA-161 / DSM 6008 / Z-2901) TaxID=246194 RepID=Q3ABK5_CARHZ|nr:hypothetical protein [Carboxydothermus hydrogenoformans]ABB14505.1 hypothetical protein CHY_1659 [Carboxydothermus hydrogenoformans Z-2901]
MAEPIYSKNLIKNPKAEDAQEYWQYMNADKIDGGPPTSLKVFRILPGGKIWQDVAITGKPPDFKLKFQYLPGASDEIKKTPQLFAKVEIIFADGTKEETILPCEGEI